MAANDGDGPAIMSGALQTNGHPLSSTQRKTIKLSIDHVHNATTRSTKGRRLRHRLSLDDALRYDLNGSVFNMAETRIQLPDSRPSSVRLPDLCVGRDEHRSSLEVILEKGTLSRDLEAGLPAFVPLPKSRPESLQGPGEMSGGLSSDLPCWPPLELPILKLPVEYEATLRSTTEAFRHLRNGKFRAKTRRSTLVNSLSYLDLPIPAYGRGHSHVERNLMDPAPAGHEVPIGTVPATVKQRLIIVEDLSPETIQFLGQFEISPEFFEEHLINSGYDGANYNDPPSSTWNTSGMKKSHISIKWHRPVLRLPKVSLSKQELQDILYPDIGRIDYIPRGPGPPHVLRTETNIFRSAWELWTDSKQANRKKQHTVCGWEERASVWVKNITDGCQLGAVPDQATAFIIKCANYSLVILLLDPLPMLSEGTERTIVRRKTAVLSEPENPLTGDNANIYENFPTDVDAAEREPALGGDGISSIPALPNDVEAAERALRPKRCPYKQPQLTRVQRIMSMIPRFKRKYVRRNDRSSTEAEIIQRTIFEKLQSLPIVAQTASRARIEISTDEAFQQEQLMYNLKSQLKDTQSTKLEYCERLLEVQNLSGFVLLQPLFEIIKQDVIGMLKQIRSSFDQINLHILDDDKMEESLSAWREMITRAQFELPDLQHSLTSFVDFMPNIKTAVPKSSPFTSGSGSIDKPFNDNMMKGYNDLMKEIEEMIRRLESAPSYIIQNMSLLDSRRSIAEAEGIAKLTECK